MSLKDRLQRRIRRAYDSVSEDVKRVQTKRLGWHLQASRVAIPLVAGGLSYIGTPIAGEAAAFLGAAGQRFAGEQYFKRQDGYSDHDARQRARTMSTRTLIHSQGAIALGTGVAISAGSPWTGASVFSSSPAAAPTGETLGASIAQATSPSALGSVTQGATGLSAGAASGSTIVGGAAAGAGLWGTAKAIGEGVVTVGGVVGGVKSAYEALQPVTEKIPEEYGRYLGPLAPESSGGDVPGASGAATGFAGSPSGVDGNGDWVLPAAIVAGLLLLGKAA